MTAEASYTINEFCAAERISRGLLYKMWRAGKGPRFYLVGEYEHRRISHEARVEWRKEREAAAMREVAA